MSNGEKLVEAMEGYLPGDREERRQRTIRLLDEVIDRKAVEMLSRKYALQGYPQLKQLQGELEELPRLWKKQELEKGLAKNGKKAKGTELQEESESDIGEKKG